MNDLELDSLYQQLLRIGLMNIRLAACAGQSEWVLAQAELLHNVPTLIGDPNPERHRYFWNCERVAFQDWIAEHGTAEIVTCAETYYEPTFAGLKQQLELWKQAAMSELS